MNRAEFNNWSREFFTAFPGAWHWLSDKSPDVQATLKAIGSGC